MHLMHELTPSSYLPDEALFASDRDVEFLGFGYDRVRQ